MMCVYMYVHTSDVTLYHSLCMLVVCLAGEQLERAFHLSLAALLGEGVYNFGELVCWYICVLCVTIQDGM